MATIPLSREELATVCGHHYFTDALFEQGYRMLLEDLDGKRVLEVCSGDGGLANWLAGRTTAEIVGVDGSPVAIANASEKYGSQRNLKFVCRDASNLPDFADGTFDLIVGQAALHHLAGSLDKVSQEYSRLLKPGGRVVFIFEPLGHNPLVAAIRAVHNTRCQWIDEANLYEWILREFGKHFSRYEVYYFSLFAYFCKALPKHARLSRLIYKTIHACDQRILARLPGARKYAANVNVCYWK